MLGQREKRSSHVPDAFFSNQKIVLFFKPLQIFLSRKLLLSVAAGLIYMQYLELISIPGKQIPLAML